MSDVITDRPVTFADLEAFEHRIDKKLEAIRAEFRGAVDTKASVQDVDARIKPLQETVCTVTAVAAEIKGSLAAILTLTEGRVNGAVATAEMARKEAQISIDAAQALSAELAIFRTHLFGDPSGTPTGYFGKFEMLNRTLDGLPARNAQAINEALMPISADLTSTKALVNEHARFINTRKRIETSILSVSGRAWKWLTTRSPILQSVMIFGGTTLIGALLAPGFDYALIWELVRALLYKALGI